jgi:hypothetical protein
MNKEGHSKTSHDIANNPAKPTPKQAYTTLSDEDLDRVAGGMLKDASSTPEGRHNYMEQD